MSLALLSFIFLSLFMIHEFDEIILVKPWIKQNQDHPAYQKEMFIAGKSGYKISLFGSRWTDCSSNLSNLVSDFSSLFISEFSFLGFTDSAQHSSHAGSLK